MIRRNFYESNAQVLHSIKYFLFQINNYLLSPSNARLIALLKNTESSKKKYFVESLGVTL